MKLEQQIRVAAATVMDDPIELQPTGQMAVNFHQYRPLVVPRTAILDLHYFGTVVLGLAYRVDGREYHGDGSAVLIAPGVAYAAKHALQAYEEELRSGRRPVVAISPAPPGGEDLLIWRVKEIILGEPDIGILRLALASPIPKKAIGVAGLTTRAPRLGDPVMIAGLRITGSGDSGEALESEVRVSVGEITTVHLNERNSVMLPFPGLEVACPALGGMSGGSAFDLNGRLIGIVGSSFDDLEGPTYVSQWWPIAAWRLQEHWLPKSVRLPTNIVRLATAGHAQIDRPERLRIGPGMGFFKMRASSARRGDRRSRRTLYSGRSIIYPPLARTQAMNSGAANVRLRAERPFGELLKELARADESKGGNLKSASERATPIAPSASLSRVDVRWFGGKRRTGKEAV